MLFGAEQSLHDGYFLMQFAHLKEGKIAAMKRKNRGLLFLICCILLISGCAAQQEKRIQINDPLELFFEKGQFVPAAGFAWQMSSGDFLALVHGAQTMDPNSEEFDPLRYEYVEELDVLSLTPPVRYQLDGDSKGAQLCVSFAQDRLGVSSYSWITENQVQAEKLYDQVKTAVDQSSALLVQDVSPEASDILFDQWVLSDAPQQTITLRLSASPKGSCTIVLSAKMPDFLPVQP